MVLLAGSFALTGCKSGPSSDAVSISGELTNFNADSMRLYEVSGVQMNRIAAAKVEREGGVGKFELNAKLPKTGFYLIGDDITRSVNAVLSNGEAIKMTGDAANPKSYKLEGGALNDGYAKLQARVINHNQQLQGLYQNLQLFSQSDPMQMQRIQGDISALNKTHFTYLDSLEAKADFMGKVAKMYNFKPYMWDQSHGKYGNELTYFKDAFFANLDFKDADISAMPQLYDKARAYSSTLVGSGLPTEVAKPAFDGLLARAGAGSPAHESILRGYIACVEPTKSELFTEYGNLFVQQYPADQQYVASINQAIASRQNMASGALAPDFSCATPSGSSLKLSDLRGKYVMIDFWASWCRPCRAENPNVVKAYSKYHDKGFEILGVSLDDNKGKWEAAIQQDGLTWKHVSDLQGWTGPVSQLYGVSSIPASVLVDTEGKIIARDLRGPALEEKLKEIFGS